MRTTSRKVRLQNKAITRKKPAENTSAGCISLEGKESKYGAAYKTFSRQFVLGIFLTFNYTAVLENVYGITPGNIVHIHGSLRDYTHDPVLGHSNKERLQKIRNRIAEAEKVFDEKECSICRVVNDYYGRTFKDTSRYSVYLSHFAEKNISEIIVIGHSLDGIDMTFSRKNGHC